MRFSYHLGLLVGVRSREGPKGMKESNRRALLLILVIGMMDFLVGVASRG